MTSNTERFKVQRIEEQRRIALMLHAMMHERCHHAASLAQGSVSQLIHPQLTPPGRVVEAVEFRFQCVLPLALFRQMFGAESLPTRYKVWATDSPAWSWW
jgi:hypothetical protein